MGFLSPKIPKPKPPPAVPVVDDAVVMRNEQDRLAARKRGAGTNLLTSQNGLPDLGATTSATAMGA
jgi:hypothetical protein